MLSRDNIMKTDRAGTLSPLPLGAAKPHITYVEPNRTNGKEVLHIDNKITLIMR